MKTIFYPLLALAIACCAFAGCTTKGDLETSDRAKTSVQSISDEHFVGIDQVLSYIGEKRPTTKGAQNAYRLEAYNSAEGDTLMYIINYGNGDGWQILSTDTRTPAVIAESSTGRFSLEEGSPAVQVWMDMTATDIANIRNLPDEKLNFSEDEIAAHKAFWASKESGTRGLDDPPVGPPLHGYWAVDVYSQTVVTDSLDHMVPQWHQEVPYNAYCPFRTDTVDIRASAGCVAVAGAQTLYYLHSLWGVPATIYSSCVCTGNINNYSLSFYNATTNAWAAMDPEYLYPFQVANAEAILIAYSGSLVQTNYGNEGSSATFDDLRTGLLSPIGIDSRKRNYDADTVKQNLLNNLPVIVSATDLLIPINGRNHCFVIDGYKRTYTRTTYLHHWVAGIMDLDPGIYEPYYTYSDSNFDITAIKINWGWGTQWAFGINEGWFGLTADWYVQVDENHNNVFENNELFNYNHNVQMIYGFHL